MFYVKTEKVDQRQDDVTRRHRGDTGCGGGRNEQGDMVARDMETTEDVEETVAGWHHKERCRRDRGCGGNSGRVASQGEA